VNSFIRLPVLKEPEYVSPTGFNVFKSCNYKYWAQYLTGERTRLPATPPMVIGSIFDAIVKSEIAKDLNWFNKDTTLSLDTLLKNIENPDFITGQVEVLGKQVNLLQEGWKIFHQYKTSGAYGDLLAEGVIGVELDSYKTIKDTQFKQGIPIFGKPDCKIKDRIADFKVNGFGSASGQSPKPGYARIYDAATGRGPAHKTNWLPMESIYPDWATQLTIYDWCERPDEVIDFRDINVAIEQVVIRPSGIRFASFRTIVSSDYQRGLYAQLEQMWHFISNGIFDKPEYHKSKCFSFNKKCEVADRCSAYQELFANEMLKAVMGLD
jgi:hypothetical protein